MSFSTPKGEVYEFYSFFIFFVFRKTFILTHIKLHLRLKNTFNLIATSSSTKARTTTTTTTTESIPSTCITRPSAVHLYNGAPYIFNDRILHVSNDKGFIRPRPDGSFPLRVDAVHRKVGDPNQVVFMHDET